MDISSALNNAYTGLQIQQQRFDRGVSEITSSEALNGRDTRTQDRALVEQQEIASSFQANARSLEAAGERIGTIIDIKV